MKGFRPWVRAVIKREPMDCRGLWAPYGSIMKLRSQPSQLQSPRECGKYRISQCRAPRHHTSVLASLLPQYSTPQHWYPLSLGISIPALSVLHSSVSASLALLSISIPRTPQYQHPSHSSVLASLTLRSLRYQASVSLSCIRTPIHNPASVSPCISFVSLHSPYTPQYHRYSYTPTNLFYQNTQTFPMEQSSLQLYNET